MAIRDKLRESIRPHLDEDEEIEAVFLAQTVSGWFLALGGVIALVFFARSRGGLMRLVAVTNRRIIVARSGAMKPTSLKEVIRELPRSTSIGPASGLWYRTESLGERLYINRRFHNDVSAADTRRPPSEADQPPPLNP